MKKEILLIHKIMVIRNESLSMLSRFIIDNIGQSIANKHSEGGFHLFCSSEMKTQYILESEIANNF